MYRTGHVAWRAREDGFAAWRHEGTAVDAAGVLRGVGDAYSPVVRPDFGAREAIPSWNASTPVGTWLEVGLRARSGGRWTNWYELGSWSSRDGARRHSVAGQRDVATDTLVLARTVDSFQLALRLRSSRSEESPAVRLAALAFSEPPPRPRTLVAGDPALWGTTLEVPAFSQMVYPDGGEAWCSPTSVAMVVAYWQRYRGAAEQLVRKTVRGTYDRVYGGNGNWSFNAAFAATQGLEAQVARLPSLRDVERWVAAGVPVVVSYRGPGNGHLAVVVGFAGSGDPVVNDPAAPRDDEVQRTYERAWLERLWLEHSGGTVYLIHPPRHAVPALP